MSIRLNARILHSSLELVPKPLIMSFAIGDDQVRYRNVRHRHAPSLTFSLFATIFYYLPAEYDFALALLFGLGKLRYATAHEPFAAAGNGNGRDGLGLLAKTISDLK